MWKQQVKVGEITRLESLVGQADSYPQQVHNHHLVLGCNHGPHRKHLNDVDFESSLVSPSHTISSYCTLSPPESNDYNGHQD